jgi:dihydrofolate reductase
MLGMIWAQANGGVIGRAGGMPWHLPEDLAHFRRTTGGQAVIMGRASWDALPAAFRPLPGRRNIVLSRRAGFAAEGAETAGSLADALELVAGQDAWICGGAQVYAAALALADVVVVTDIDLEIDGDAHAPDLGSEWVLSSREPADGWHRSAGGLGFRISAFRRTD